MGSVGVVSRGTRTVAGIGLLVSAASLVLIRLGVGGSESGEAFIGSLPSLLTGAGASVMALWAALRFGRGESLRRVWLLVGLGMALLFVGDAVYAYLEVVARREVPFPSVADLFYLLSFVFLAGGPLLALVGFRNSLDLRKPLLLALGLCVVVTAALWSGVFQQLLADTEVTEVERLLGILYPAGDVWLLLFPAMALALALAPLGGGRLAWPWWALAVAFVSIAAADTAFTLQESAGTYVTGSLVDAGWWMGYTGVAVGASLLVDVQRPFGSGDAS